jgi:hypothetical protein
MRRRRNNSTTSFELGESRPGLRHWLVYVAASLPVLFGLYLFGAGARNVARGLVSKQWPTTPGVVVRSDTARRVTEDPDHQTTSVSYSAKVEVRYRVQNRNYSTETLYFGQTVGSEDSSEAELRRFRYPTGAEVVVSYDPQNPSVSTVKPGIAAEAFELPIAGLAFALPGFMLPFLFLRKAKEDSGLVIAMGIFATAFCTVGVLMTGAGLFNLWRAHASTRWPTAAGIIVHRDQDSTTNVSRNKQGRLERSTTHAVRLVYEYTVENEKHYSNIRRFGELGGASKEWAINIAERYRLGNDVQVSYYPRKPDIAILEPGINSETLWLPGAGLAILAFGSAVFKWGIPMLAGKFSGDDK